MRIEPWTIALQAINFLILAWILGRLFFRPVAQVIADRAAAVQALLTETAQARDEAEVERQSLAGARAQIEAERAAAQREAIAQAEDTRRKLEAEARAEAERIREAAGRDSALARAAGERAMREDATRLAVDIAARLLERLRPATALDGLPERLASQVAALPPASREDPNPAAAVVTLAAAGPLPAGVAQACEAALIDSLGGGFEWQVEQAPQLIAGYELRLPRATVRDNLRADLERIAAALAGQPTGGGA